MTDDKNAEDRGQDEGDERPTSLEEFRGHMPKWNFKHPGTAPADIAHGVKMVAPWEDPFAGFPAHGRRLAVAMHKAGVPIKLLGTGAPQPEVDTQDKERAMAFAAIKELLAPMVRASIRNFLAEVFHTIAEDAALMRIAGPRHHWMSREELEAVHSCRIISTVFERDSISDQARLCLRRLGQVWVANNTDAAMLIREGVDQQRVRVLPIPWFDTDFAVRLRGRARPSGMVRFYHIGKWEPRKAQDKLIRAFLTAFGPSEATLSLKTSRYGPRVDGYPDSPKVAVIEALEDPAVRAKGWTKNNVAESLFIITKRLSDIDIGRMHRWGDIYVSVSRGEGFDMPAYDAKLAGNRLVYTPTGGPLDFSDEYDVLVPSDGKVDCHDFYGWQPGARYLDYRVEEAAEALKRAAHGVQERKQKKMPKVLREMHCDVVGKKAAGFLTELAPQLELLRRAEGS